MDLCNEESTTAGQDEEGREHLAAVCGTYCGACQAYLAKHQDNETRIKRRKLQSSGQTKRSEVIPAPNWMDGLRCDGCLSGGEIPPHCQNCSMKVCAAGKPGVTRCSDCDELPCHRIQELIDTGLLHRAEYMPNLRKIREMGVQDWVKYEKERWSCPRCGLPLSWYDAECVGCGKARPTGLFPLTPG